MDEKYRNIILVICVVIVLVILLDLIFNLTRIKVETFETSESNTLGSIISKQDGRMFNIEGGVMNQDKQDIYIESPLHTNTNISVNDDNTIGEKHKNTGDTKQTFELYKISTLNDFKNIASLNAQQRGVPFTNYPFYIITPKKTLTEKMALAYEPGRLFLIPLGMYSNQIWDVSLNRNHGSSIVLCNVSDTNIGSVNNSGLNNSDSEAFDPEKIKINLNLTDELKTQLFGVNSNGKVNSSTNGQCASTISKTALGSICPGCDADKL